MSLVDDGPVMVTSLRSLLSITRCPTLRDLADYIQSKNELDDDPAVYGLGRFANDGIEVRIGGTGILLEYPFSITELWEVVDYLEAIYDAETAYSWLRDEILIVEGISVWIAIDEGFNSSLLNTEYRRRVFSNGYEVQAVVPPYPYKRAMSGTRTYDHWRSNRFQRNFPGLAVFLCSPEGTVIRGDTTLSDLRLRAEG